MDRIRSTIFALSIILVGVSPAVAGSDSSGASFAERAVPRFRQQLPGYDIGVADPLAVTIGKNGKIIAQLNLDRVARYCAANPDQCDSALNEYIDKAASLVRSVDAPLTASMLRAVVRPSDYIRNFETETKSKSDDEKLVTVPLPGDLVLVCEFDFPTATRPVRMMDLKPLGLDPQQAVDACKKNVEAGLPSIDSQTRALSKRSFGTIRGDGYVSSEFLFPERWAHLAAKQDGHLTVAIPGDNLIIYGHGDDQTDIDAMSTLVKRLVHSVERPISTDVFRWTPSGWQVVSRN